MLPSRLTSKPQYVLHPFRALRRTQRMVWPPPADAPPKVAHLPWGLPLRVHEIDAIGYSILVGRVFDPCVTEAIHRLTEPGELVVDVGANVGYLTSLAAVRSGPAGRVVAVEPHPVVFELLRSNVESWAGMSEIAPVELHQLALADRDGVGTILAGPQFDLNMGLATLADADATTDDGAQGDSVRLCRLDQLLGGADIGVLKIDVEGHEVDVLRGASELLDARAVRDIVFEDHDPYPSAVTSLVEEAGYHLVSLANDLGGLVLQRPVDRGEVPAWPGPSYLATREPSRSFPLLAARGWQVEGIGFSAPRLRRPQASP